MSDVLTKEEINALRQTLKEAIEEIEAKSEDERVALAKYPNTDADIVAKIKEDNRREALAENPNTPPETLAMLAGDEYASVRLGVAENPNTPPETLAMLAGDEYAGAREAVAENPNTPPEILGKMWEDNKKVREALAGNSNTPAKTLALLLRVADVDTRRALAKNKNTDPETLKELTVAAKGDFPTLYNIVLHKNTLKESLEYIRKETDDRVLKDEAKQAIASRKRWMSIDTSSSNNNKR